MQVIKAENCFRKKWQKIYRFHREKTKEKKMRKNNTTLGERGYGCQVVSEG